MRAGESCGKRVKTWEPRESFIKLASKLLNCKLVRTVETSESCEKWRKLERAGEELVGAGEKLGEPVALIWEQTCESLGIVNLCKNCKKKL